MENYLSEIKKKLTKNLKLEELKVIDQSNLHKNHKSFQKNKYHIKLEIKSNELNLLTRIEAQKKIMNILRNDLELKIHALEIKIR